MDSVAERCPAIPVMDSSDARPSKGRLEGKRLTTAISSHLLLLLQLSAVIAVNFHCYSYLLLLQLSVFCIQYFLNITVI